MTKKEAIEKIQELSLISDDELYAQIGAFVSKNTMGVEEEDKKQKRILGKAWFNFNIEDIKKKICKSQIVNKFKNNNSYENKLELTSVLLDFFISDIDFPVFAVIALILKTDIYDFCKDEV